VDRRAYLVALLVAAAVGAPFLTKAYHIDDTFVLAVSDQILKDPLRPFDTTINWRNDPMPIREITKNPPLLSYYLAPFIAEWGYDEIALHGAMMVFLVLLAVGAALVGAWFWVGPWWPMLFVMFSPLVLVSPNVMRDVPAAALGTFGMALFVLGSDDSKKTQTAFGALFVGLAVLTKYSSASLIPVMGLYLLLHRRWRQMLWLLIPTGLLGLWCLHNGHYQGEPHIWLLMRQRADNFFGWHYAWQEKGLAGLTILGSSLFLLPVVIVAWLRKWTWPAILLIAVAGAGAWFAVNAHFGNPSGMKQPDTVVLKDGKSFAGEIVERSEDGLTLRMRDRRSMKLNLAEVAEVRKDEGLVLMKNGNRYTGDVTEGEDGSLAIALRQQDMRVRTKNLGSAGALNWQYYLWAMAGAGLVVVAALGGLFGAVRAATRREGGADWLFLLAWAAVPIAFSVVLAPFQASRHFLPAIVPLTVIVLRLLGEKRQIVTGTLAGVLVLQAAVGYVVAFGDAEAAAVQRDFADYVAKTYKRDGREVWFNGHWGWMQYALRVHGFKQISQNGDTPPAGAILVDLKRTHHSTAPEGLNPDRPNPRLHRLEEKAYPCSILVRTVDNREASFYAVSGHKLPYLFTTDETPHDVGRVYRVTEKPVTENGGPE